MKIYETLLLAVSLSMDSFAVTFSASASGHGKKLRPALRLAFHIGLFSFLMLILGWFSGSGLAGMFQRYNRWATFGLLAAVGSHMLYEAFWRLPDELPADPTRGIRMVTLSVATNLDALAVGLSLGIAGVPIWYPVVIIGLVTMGLSLLGIYLGGCLQSNLGKRMEIAGGIVIILIGLRALF